jgi:hypothetical protein
VFIAALVILCELIGATSRLVDDDSSIICAFDTTFREVASAAQIQTVPCPADDAFIRLALKNTSYRKASRAARENLP